MSCSLGSVLVVAILTLSPCARAVFNIDLDGADIDGDGNPLNNLLVCGDNPLNIPLHILPPTMQRIASDAVELDIRNNSGPFVPVSSRVPTPPSIENLSPFIMAQLMNFLQGDINGQLQRIADPRLDASDAPPENPCNISTGEELQDNNQISPFDIPRLWERRINDVGGTVQSDALTAAQRTFQRLNCYLQPGWTDAGPTFFPRYFAGPTCLGRNCSLPDGNGQICLPDFSRELSDPARLTALRWDCCWTVGRMRNLIYTCGWRKVNFPLLCDCDCTCTSSPAQRSLKK